MRQLYLLLRFSKNNKMERKLFYFIISLIHGPLHSLQYIQEPFQGTTLNRKDKYINQKFGTIYHSKLVCHTF